ncbi:MAG TPA: hypothetical protein VJ735_09370 [Actinomycetes bacterium]|nr:hypothetical protein [Actinomycetes bacterium]
MSPSMPTRLDRPTATGDPVVLAVLAVTALITAIGILALVRAAVGDGGDHVTVRIDNQPGWPSRSTRWTPRATGSASARPSQRP